MGPLLSLKQEIVAIKSHELPTVTAHHWSKNYRMSNPTTQNNESGGGENTGGGPPFDIDELPDVDFSQLEFETIDLSSPEFADFFTASSSTTDSTVAANDDQGQPEQTSAMTTTPDESHHALEGEDIISLVSSPNTETWVVDDLFGETLEGTKVKSPELSNTISPSDLEIKAPDPPASGELQAVDDQGTIETAPECAIEEAQVGPSATSPAFPEMRTPVNAIDQWNADIPQNMTAVPSIPQPMANSADAWSGMPQMMYPYPYPYSQLPMQPMAQYPVAWNPRAMPQGQIMYPIWEPHVQPPNNLARSANTNLPAPSFNYPPPPLQPNIAHFRRINRGGTRGSYAKAGLSTLGPLTGFPSDPAYDNHPITKPTTANHEVFRFNKAYKPNPACTPLAVAPRPWGPFRYTNLGELDPAMQYTPEEITRYLFEHPLHHGRSSLSFDLSVRLQRSPNKSQARYPTTLSHRCKFTNCPLENINQGQYQVAFDENDTRNPGQDPFIVAGYVHLYCLERFCDLPRIIRELNVAADTRSFPNEKHGIVPQRVSQTHERKRLAQAKSATSHEERIIEVFINECRSGLLQGYPSHTDPNRPHEGTLVHRLAKERLRVELPSVRRQRLQRAGKAGYQGSTLSVHLGDLEREAEIRNRTRKHKNQNQLKPNPKRKRKFAETEDSEDEDDFESDEDDEEEEEEDEGTLMSEATTAASTPAPMTPISMPGTAPMTPISMPSTPFFAGMKRPADADAAAELADDDVSFPTLAPPPKRRNTMRYPRTCAAPELGSPSYVPTHLRNLEGADAQVQFLRWMDNQFC